MHKIFTIYLKQADQTCKISNKVSLVVDFWMITNQVSIIDMTIHCINVLWFLIEQILAVEELVG